MPKNNFLLIYSYSTFSETAAFFLGLFEGAGGVYFRKTKNKYSPYFLILLDDHPENKHMLEYFNMCLQLKASIYRKKAGKKRPKIVMQGESVITMCTLFDIVNKYGLLTSKKIVMFDILMKSGIWPNSHTGKNTKIYLSHPVVIDKLEQNRVINDHGRVQSRIETTFFNPWLSGFLEKKAGFASYANQDIRMYMSVQNDYYLINAIKQHFQSDCAIVKINHEQHNSFSLTLSKTSLCAIQSHFQRYPFLGYQNTLFKQYCNNVKLSPPREIQPVPTLNSSLLPNVSQNYLEPFLVGLLDGGGSIHLHRTKGGNFSYGAFKINLKYYPENHAMLSLIKNCIGGSIYYRKKIKKGDPQILWTAVRQDDVKRILAILDKYPPLTSRKVCQHAYLKHLMLNRDWNYHLKTRDSKYDTQEQLIKHYKHHFKIPDYFAPWLSGFFEAEGHFGFIRENNFRVHICQNDDWYLLNAIKTYFQSHHKRLHKDARYKKPTAHYRISMTGKPTIERIIKHFINNPLLGYKKAQFDSFCDQYKQKYVS